MPSPNDSDAALAAFADYAATLKGDEKGEAQVFLDRLFRAFGHGGVSEAGATLESRVKRQGRGTGFADLLWPGRVLIEMKKGGEDLGKHFDQARDYWMNTFPKPRYVVLCNFREFWIYDLNVQHDPLDKVPVADLVARQTAFGFLYEREQPSVFDNNRVKVTREAAGKVAQVFNSMIAGAGTRRPEPRERAQRFILQSVVAMFGEDTGLLPSGLFVELLDEARQHPERSYDLFGGLFRQMNTPEPARGGRYRGVPYFNGGLFAAVEPVELSEGELFLLEEAARQDWSKVQPPVFGALFEASMDEGKRHASGAHFTYEVDIQKIVLPTLVRPWRERIAAADTLTALAEARRDLARFHVLDPACGSGNFLYVAFRELKRLELALLERIREKGFTPAALRREGIDFASVVSPRQFFGLDTSAFAVELAKVTLMIAKELARRELLDAVPAGQAALDLPLDASLPLDNLDANVRQADALFADWPAADAIVGNPPFQSKNKMQQELGADYVRRLRARYPDVPGRADYCVYWIRRAHDHLPAGGRAGLVGTNTIRQNYSREGGLDHVVATGGTITEAVASQVWSGDAAVHVSLVNWVKGDAPGPKRLSWQKGDRLGSPLEAAEVDRIPASLSPLVDVTGAASLRANVTSDACYQGQIRGHEGFLLDVERARALLKDASARPAVFPFMIGDDLVGRSAPSRYIIDLNRCEDVFCAQQFGKAFEQVKARVLPDVEKKAEEERAEGKPGRWAGRLRRWWKFERGRGELISRLDQLPRYIACSRVTKRPIFEFIDSGIRPDDTVQVFPLADDYSFGILQSGIHWAWFVARCSTMKADWRYTSNTVFDSFPWPQAPTLAQVRAVAEAAVALRTLRRDLTTRHGLSLRDLYRTLDTPGQNPLRAAHERLDQSVRAAYAMPPKADVLAFLLDLNQTLAAAEAAGTPIVGPGLPPSAPDASAFVTPDAVRPAPL